MKNKIGMMAAAAAMMAMSVDRSAGGSGKISRDEPKSAGFYFPIAPRPNGNMPNYRNIKSNARIAAKKRSVRRHKARR